MAFLTNLLPVSLFLITSISFGAEEVTFQKNETVVRKTTVAALKKDIHEKNIRVRDTSAQAEIVYQALPADQVFEKIYGSDWKKADKVIFTCLDGYQPTVPTKLFSEIEGYFAFSRVGSTSFSLLNKTEGNKEVNVGPLYLVWNNLKNKSADPENGSFWPYQIKTVDLVVSKK